MKAFLSVLFLSILSASLGAKAPLFKSHLFEKGTLVYSDDFDGELNRERWQPRTKNWKVKDGVLIGAPDYKNAEEAEKALGRDHHLGLGPVIRLNQLPESFVCHMRFKYEGEDFQAARPKLDIGHHINNLFFRQGGYSLKLSGGELIEDRQSGFELNEWVDLVIEMKEGKLLIELNGHQRIFEHEQVSMQSHDEFTFKALDGASSRLVIDYVRLWKAE
ncbi:MAG: hypothetical protein HOI15_12455 [Opitutales bacterium]|nr:hypothetical protein [Opitutales bacterium]